MSQTPQSISNHATVEGALGTARIHHADAISRTPTTMSLAPHVVMPPAASANGAMISQTPTRKLIQI